MADTDDFERIGKEAQQARQAAYKSYSDAAGVVRERLMEFAEVVRTNKSPEVRERHQQALAAAESLKQLTERELEHADENWREWVEEARARREDERLTRQEKATNSTTWAAWAAALAAFMSVVVTAWQVFGPHRS
jgi:hypothetical protein